MSSVPDQIMSRNASIATPQEMEAINTWFDQYQPIDEDDLQSTAFNHTYSGSWPANMPINEQIDPSYVNYSHDNPPDLQSAGQLNEAFVDPSLNVPTYLQPPGQLPQNFIDQSQNIPVHMQSTCQFTGPFVDQSPNNLTPMQPAGQLTGPFVNQSHNHSPHMQSAGQFTGAFVDQTPNVPTHMQLVGQSTLSSLDQSRNTPTNIQGIGQFTTSTANQSCNVSTNVQPLGQHNQSPIEDGGNTTTSVPPDGQATPAPARYRGNGNKTMQATWKSSPASAQGRKKHPAIVEDKDIERSAGKYNISYDEIRILKDYANARLKGIETSEPKDAPSQYIISRFEKVRRTSPEHATWPYDIPKEKIVRLLPGQKRQDRAPIKSYHDACEKRRQELDTRYHESRQWEGPPPPPPNQAHQNTLTAPGIGDVPTGLTPPPSGNPNSAEAGETSTIETSTMMQHDSMDSFDEITPSAVSYDVRMDDFEDGVQLSSPLPPTSTPNQPDSVNAQNFLGDGRAASDNNDMADLEERLRSALEEYLYGPSPPSSPLMPSPPLLLPTPNPPEYERAWPLHQDQPKEQHPFILPNFDPWPTGAPIICHPLVRALEVHAGRKKEPHRLAELKGFTMSVSKYIARVPQFPAPADSESKPEAEYLPQGYALTEELKEEIELRIRLHMKLRWGMDDDDGQKARSGELVREDLWRAAGEKLEMET